MFSHILFLGMRNSLLSLFVSAAIIGSVLSSSHAEITISPQACNKLIDLNLERLREFWKHLNGVLEKNGLKSELCYDDEAFVKDMYALCDVVYTKNSGLPLTQYCSGGAIGWTRRKSFIQLANDAFEEHEGEELRWLFFKKGIEVFLKYCMCHVAVDLPGNFEKLKTPHYSVSTLTEKVWKRIYVGEGGIWAPDFMLEHMDPVYRDHRGNPFKLRELAEKLIRENESVFRKEWFPGTVEVLTDRQITSLFAEKFFSDDYVRQVRNVVVEGCFPGCKNEAMFRFNRLAHGETPIQTMVLVKYTQLLRDYRDAKKLGSLEAKDRFQKGAKFLSAFCIGDRNAEKANGEGYRFVNPNLRERILDGVRNMQKEFEK